MKEVIIRWGDYGKKIKNIRAKITRFPYMNDVGTDQKYDMDSIPVGNE